ncbi:hypothetical protein CWC18_01415 [Pseudoalteromonas aurantia]|uniref:hypothetical protein n=1 Tax=Pseudoalteromonas aurantia TaxID=43654 RepID=UPI00110A1D23|nr:hypothetical protein [Pseudoalteromonas aurantia]TMO67094.1 hypothetical protein CWC18_01415 [Pseudoalteromonas aurantia]
MIEKIKEWFFSKYVNYYADGYYKFVRVESGYELKKVDVKKGFITIFARAQYTEVVDKVPMSERGAIAAVLKTKKHASLPKVLFFLLGKRKTESTYFNCWTFLQEVPANWFMLPESYIFTSKLNDGDVLEYCLLNSCFCSQTHGLTYSVKKTAIISDSQCFAYSVGCNVSRGQKALTTECSGERLYHGFYCRGQDLFKFINWQYLRQCTAQMKEVVIALTLCCLTYFIVTSAYLTYASYSTTKDLQGKKAEVNAALNVLSRFQVKESKFNAQNAIFSNSMIVSPVFFVFENISKKAELDSMEFIEGRYIFRGTAIEAIEVLEAIKGVERVGEAQFDFPISKSGQRERFVISFILNTDQDRLEYKGGGGND